MSRGLRWITLSAALLAGSCETPTRYEWGSYESSVYAITTAEADVGAEIEGIETTLQRGRDRDKPAPPGMHAHLGYLYLLRDDPDSATAAFETEKELFPESAAFVDGLLERMGAKR